MTTVTTFVVRENEVTVAPEFVVVTAWEFSHRWTVAPVARNPALKRESRAYSAPPEPTAGAPE